MLTVPAICHGQHPPAHGLSIVFSRVGTVKWLNAPVPVEKVLISVTCGAISMIHTKLMMHADNRAGRLICSMSSKSVEVKTFVRTFRHYFRKTILKKMPGFFATIVRLYRISSLKSLQPDGPIGRIIRERLHVTRRMDLREISPICMLPPISPKQKEQKYSG